MRGLISILLLLSLVVRGFGQTPSISVSLDGDSITIGDIIEVDIQINNISWDEVTGIDFGSWKTIKNHVYSQDTILFEEYLDFAIIDDNEFGISDENLQVQKPIRKDKVKIKMGIYNIGSFTIPEPEIFYEDSLRILPLERPSLIVYPPQGISEQDSLTLAPIKEILIEEKRLSDYYDLIFTILAIIAAVLLFIWYSKRKTKDGLKKEVIIDVVVPAHDVALEALHKLKKANLWQEGQEKEYHSRLTRIMKQYVNDRYEINALEMTTDQFRKEMKGLGMNEEITNRLADIFQISDIVKFAKGKAGSSINLEFMEKAFDIVNQTKVKSVDND